MAVVVFLIIVVVVLVLVLVAIVFCRGAHKSQNGQLDATKLLDSPTDSPTPSPSTQGTTPWTVQHHHQQQQMQHLQHMQQMWQMQQMQQQMQQMQQQLQLISIRTSMHLGPPQRPSTNSSLQEDRPSQAVRSSIVQESPTVNAHLTALPPPPMHPVLQPHKQHLGMDGGAAMLGSSGLPVLAERSQDTCKLFPALAEYRLNALEVTLTRKISTGSFGVIWLAHYQGQPVAVKKMIHGLAKAKEEEEEEEEEQTFVKEILIMARMNHPKIVKFLGCTWTQPTDLAAVTEFMKGGDLSSVLENKRIELRWQKEKVSIAIDIAEALQYLHTLSPKLIHRDLKSRNVLLDAKLTAKLSDFGLSRNRTYEESLTVGVGTVRWTAPEVMLGENYTEQADIYSLGVVLSELDTRQVPFEESSSGVDMNIVIKVAHGELRPTFSPEVPPCIDRIAQACLQFDPTLRPTATQVAAMLHEAKAELTELTL